MPSKRFRYGPRVVGALRPEDVEGRRIKVLRVAHSQTEQLGFVDDTDILTGQTGLVVKLHNPYAPQGMRQLEVKWDDPKVGVLFLMSADEIQFEK
jgi:hypothetical protein